nr:flagellar filament capping protein FliD [uncultured Rhodoferax sp.]
MAISSVGIGSGLDVNGIVSQLVALEKAPLTSLKTKSTNIQAQVSSFGEIKSMFSDLTDVATRVSDPSVWSARTASASDTNAVSVKASPTATATSFSLDVDALAKQQSNASAPMAKGTTLAAGTLKFQVGAWNEGGTTFTAGASRSVDVKVQAGDTLANVASKINTSGAEVVAAVFNDGTRERLLLSAKGLGAANGFRVQSADVGLQGLIFDPQNSPAAGMAAAGIPVQLGSDARARINGLAVTSPSNTLTNYVDGVTIDLLATTTTDYGLSGETKKPVTVSVSENVTTAVKNVEDLITAYNKLNSALTELTKYDSETKSAGLFQGDSTIVGMQSVLRSIVSSTSKGNSLQRLSDVGIEMARDGSLSMNTAKLGVAANNGDTLQKLFTANNNDPMTNGFAIKLRDLGKGVLATGGAVVNKSDALNETLKKNEKEQLKVTDRAASVEARLRKQYSALDTKMANLNALNTYVGQQVTAWNKSKD